MNSDNMFQDDDSPPKGKPPSSKNAWKILSVDDEPAVHDLTRMVLDDFIFEGNPVEIASANSGSEAIEYMRKHNDVVLILLDVVMEENHAGFAVVEAIRQEFNNQKKRIIIRTGQAGDFSMEETMSKYDVDGYIDKSKLTHNYLHALVYSALRSYRETQTIVKNQAHQANFIKKIQSINQVRDIDCLLSQLETDLVELLPDVEVINLIIANAKDENIFIEELVTAEHLDTVTLKAQRDYLLIKSNDKDATVQMSNQLLFRRDLTTGKIFKLHIKSKDTLDDELKNLFIAYCSNISALYELGQIRS